MGEAVSVGVDFGKIAGFQYSTSTFIERDDLIFFFGPKPQVKVDLKLFEPSGEKDRHFQMQAYASMYTKTLKRPSWLHPIKRVLWVHHHGPHRPTVQVPMMDLKSVGVIKNIA